MALNPFDSSKLKLKRASQHIQELTFSIESYLATEPISIVVEQPAEFIELGSHVWVVHIKTPVPADFSTVIGDAVHNLRSALDLLASDVVRLNGRSPDNVHFPFAKTAAGLEEQIKARNFNRAHADAKNLLRTIRPYTGGNAALRGLHDLDLRDKHYALIPSISAAKTQPFIMKMGAALNPIPEWHSTIPKDGWWMVVMPAMDNVPLGSKVRAEFTLVFDDKTTFAGDKIIPTLHGLAQNVAGVAEEFETLCKGQAFPESATHEWRESVKSLIVGPTTDPAKIHRFTRIDHGPTIKS